MLEFMIGLIMLVMAVLAAGVIFFVVCPPIIHWLIEFLFD